MLLTPNGSKHPVIAAPQSPRVELAAIERACEALAQCECLNAITDFLGQAEAFRHFARKAKMGLDIVNKAAEMKMRAERRMGQLLAEMNLHGGDRVSDSHRERATLKELNISHTQSSRCQKEAEVPEGAFCELVESARENECELTTAALLRLAAALRRKREVNRHSSDSSQERSSIRRQAASSPAEILAELENHFVVFDGILASVYNADGPVDLHLAQRKHLRHLVREFRSLLSDLKEHNASQAD